MISVILIFGCLCRSSISKSKWQRNIVQRCATYKCAFFILLLLCNTEAHSVLADWLGSTHDVPSSCYSVFFASKRIFWRWHLWYIIVCPSPSIKLAFYHLTFLFLFSYRAPWHIHCTHVISISYPPRIRHLQRHVFDLPSSFSYI